MKLSLHSVRTVHSALQSLDGYERVIKEGAGERVVHVAYRFDGRTRVKIALALGAMESHLGALQTTANGLIREISEGQERIDAGNAEQVARYNAEMNAALEHEVACELDPLTFDELLRDDNPIPGSVLAALSPLIAPEAKAA